MRIRVPLELLAWCSVQVLLSSRMLQRVIVLLVAAVSVAVYSLQLVYGVVVLISTRSGVIHFAVSLTERLFVECSHYLQRCCYK